jgi:hypothetical protein
MKGDYIYNEKVSKKEYNQFIINKGLSYFKDTILYANEMNRLNPRQDKMHYDFYYYGLPKRKRFSKWHKRQDDEFMAEVAEFYNVSFAKAKEIISVLPSNKIEELKTILNRGGKNE